MLLLLKPSGAGFFLNKECCGGPQREIFSCLIKTVLFFWLLRRHATKCQNKTDLLSTQKADIANVLMGC